MTSTPDDIRVCAEIWLTASLAGHDFIPAAFWRERYDDMINQYLPVAALTMAHENGRPVAFAAMVGDRLEALFVHPDHWRRGHGGRLLRALFTRHNRLELSVYARNDRAVAFYRRAGFVETGKNRCPHTGEEELTMAWARDGLTRVRAHLKRWNKDGAVRELGVSTATVEAAAAALGVEPARIAKTLAFKTKNGHVLIVVSGDVRIDNTKFKTYFHGRMRMSNADETLAVTGHSVGGVCPFALPDPAPPVWLDVSLQRFATVFPGAGTAHSMVELAPAELFACAGAAGWIDVGKLSHDQKRGTVIGCRDA